jgi:hypothetical protein
MALDIAAAGVSLLGSALGAAKAAAPSTTAPYNLTDLGGFDFSDWTVATSGSKAQGSSDTGVLPNWLMFAGMALAAVVAVRWLKSK